MLGVLAGILRSLWGMFTLQRRGEAALFAPVAFRPGAEASTGIIETDRAAAAGPIFVALTDSPAVPQAPAVPGAAPAGLLPACLMALGLYLATIPWLQSSGSLLYATSPGAWLFRSLLLAAVAVLLSASWWHRSAADLFCPAISPARGRQRLTSAGIVLHASGLLWVALALADLHVFSVVHPVGVSIGFCADTPWLQFLTHDYHTHLWLVGPGTLAVLAGWLMFRLGRPPSAPAADPLVPAMPPSQTESPEHAARG
jgi:hypothetical protein